MKKISIILILLVSLFVTSCSNNKDVKSSNINSENTNISSQIISNPYSSNSVIEQSEPDQSKIDSILSYHFDKIDQYKSYYFEYEQEMMSLIDKLNDLSKNDLRTKETDGYLIYNNDNKIYFNNGNQHIEITDTDFYKSYFNFFSAISNDQENVSIDVSNNIKGNRILFSFKIDSIEGGLLSFDILFCPGGYDEYDCGEYLHFQNDWYYKLNYFNI